MFDQKLIKECQAFVDSYTAVVVDFIAHGATPLQVCQYLRLCPAASVTSKFTLKLIGENSKYRENFTPRTYAAYNRNSYIEFIYH